MYKIENDNQFDLEIRCQIRDTKNDDDFDQKTLSPLSCLTELESQWTIEFDLPLVNKKDISVSIDSANVITVAAKLREIYCDFYHGCKHEFQYFKKSLSLPGKIDSKRVTANFTNGRLTIYAPKLVTGNKIKIE